MKLNKKKIEAFYKLAKFLNQGLDEVPILYGSLGLNKVIGEFCEADDVDVLIEDKYIDSEWKKFKHFMIKEGYNIHNENEHEFERKGIIFGFAGKKDIENFAKIKLGSIQIIEEHGARFRSLMAKQFLKVYELIPRDDYRTEKRGEADQNKIKKIIEFISQTRHKF